ncbi:MAG: GNAT family N-acetyltransferase [Clostridia bacterium]|nr:GNAT family N-acetyltransferase [Clostridia bacterium]
MEIKRLKKENYDELISLLNLVFSKQNKCIMDFERELPNMCVRDDAHMKKHVGLFVDNKLVSVVGVYPLPTKVLDSEIKFCTVGNVATHPDYEGRGYMSLLLNKAMEIVKEEKYDACRLGGNRARYLRFGFELCGKNYSYYITPNNAKKSLLSSYGQNTRIAEILPNDEKSLTFSRKVYHQNKVSTLRNDNDVMYRVMTAWKNTPYLVSKNDVPIGYFTLTPDKKTVSEAYAIDKKSYLDTVVAISNYLNDDFSITLPQHDIALVREMNKCAEYMSIQIPSNFNIVNFEKVVDAYIKLKASYTPLVQGSVTISIKEYGKIKIFANENGCGCVSYDGECDFELLKSDATRFIFGMHPSETVIEPNLFAKANLPLPLSWNTQNRV